MRVRARAYVVNTKLKILRFKPLFSQKVQTIHLNIKRRNLGLYITKKGIVSTIPQIEKQTKDMMKSRNSVTSCFGILFATP